MDYAKELNDAVANVVETKKALANQQELLKKAVEAHDSAVQKAKDLRDNLNRQVNEALAAVGIEKADSRINVSD